MAASDNYYPGVQLVEKPFQPGRAMSGPVPAFGAFIGRADQGPTTPIEVNSWVDFTKVFGINFTDLHYALWDFFSNGGTRAYIVRIEGTGAVKATLNVYDDTVDDPLPDPPPTPLFTATAISSGAWANQLRIVTYVRDAANYRFDVALFKLPPGVSTFDETKRNSEYLVDQWLDVTLDPNDSRYFYTVANRPSATGSQYVLFTGQSYNPATPSVRPMPGLAGGYALTGGVTGVYTTPYDPATSYANAVSAMSQVPGPYILNLPNMTTASIVKAAIQAAADRGNVVVVCDPPIAQTPTEVTTYANTDLGLNSAGSKVASHGFLYYPWVALPAINAQQPGRTVMRAPGGAVVGMMMTVDRVSGPWQAPAGVPRALLAGAVDLERSLTESDLSMLNNNNINALRVVPGQGIAVMGARTLKKSGKDMYINVRRALIDVAENLKRLTEFAVFENNNERLWERVSEVCSTFLGGLWQQGGLKGTNASQAFYVRCDETNNTPATVDSGQVNIEVGVALQVPAEFIIITIGQFEGGTSVTTS